MARNIENLSVYRDQETIVDIVEYIDGPENSCYTLTDYYCRYRNIIRDSVMNTETFYMLRKYRDYYMNDEEYFH